MDLKKSALGFCLIVLSVMANAAPPPYTGKNVKGYVFIDNNGRAVYGTMNVRFDPSPGHEQSSIGCSLNTSDVIYCSAYDATQNKWFSCHLSNASPKFETAKSVVSGIGDGSFLVITKLANPANECHLISNQRNSIYMQ